MKILSFVLKRKIRKMTPIQNDRLSAKKNKKPEEKDIFLHLLISVENALEI